MLLLIIVIIVSYLLKQLLTKLLFDHKSLSLFGKPFYNYYYSIKKIRQLRTNNWGFVPIDDEIANYSADLQCGMQLYKELVKAKNGYIIHDLCSIAEIGCGKGAGAEFLVTKFKPQQYLGIDYSAVAIKFCNENYSQLSNVKFICADAHELPIETRSLDYVINVESSHIYKDIGKCFREVYRVLKEGGKFLVTDFRVVRNSSINEIENLIKDSGFSILEKKIITPHIYESCILASKRREELVNEAIPWLFKSFFYHYAVLNGTEKFKKLGNGEIVYFLYQLERKCNHVG
jgi:ubiquinone/menaquinone biosynthesis C-methylase UbiE